MKKFILLISVVVMSSSALWLDKNDKLFEITKNIEIFVNIYKELNANYVEDIDPNQLMRIGIDAMVNSLDPYTNYISESQVENYRISTEGKYQGLGALVGNVNNKITVIEPFQGSSLEKAGIIAGDEIVKINGISTLDKTSEELTQFVRGVPGTSLFLEIYRPTSQESMDITLERGSVERTNVPYSGMLNDGIAYVALSTFTQNAGKNIQGALSKLKSDNEVKGVILDLRNNGGGLLREAISLSNLFIPKGEDVVSTRSKVQTRDKSYATMAEPFDLDLPLAVLINKKSASASEIVSGVIQDFDRGVLIGQRSYGKGLVQNTKEIGYNSRVKITTSKYYIPSGRCIQSVEYEDGEPVDIPDDKRNEFKTKNGRTVLDGGGVTPDIKLDAETHSPFVKALIKQQMIFQFVTKYLPSYTKPDSVLTRIEFADMPKFKDFLAERKFSYKSDTEKEMKELLETIEADGYGNQNTITINKLIKDLETEKASAYEADKNQIQRLIEQDIATRLYFQEGKYYQRLNDDPEIIKAISTLSNSVAYQKILGN